MNPAADTLALSTTEVDLKPVAVGQSITVKWQGSPVFIRHRTAKEIKEAADVDILPICAIRKPDSAARQEAQESRSVWSASAPISGRIPVKAMKPSDHAAASSMAGMSLPRLAIR